MIIYYIIMYLGQIIIHLWHDKNCLATYVYHGLHIHERFAQGRGVEGVGGGWI